mmetsp:Transcript_13269/g.38478  ORF Transcript_13269/g.38478 Transcript_13269/m.38478 type:complete len:486 (+) Transcript_13269:527-1984(+)
MLPNSQQQTHNNNTMSLHGGYCNISHSSPCCRHLFSGDGRIHAADVRREVKLLLARTQLPGRPAHVPNLAKHGTLFPALVVQSDDRPHDAHHAVGIPAVQAVCVVEPHRKVDGLLRGLGPLQDFFRPVHANKSMLLADDRELPLRRVPNGVMGLGVSQLLVCIDMVPYIVPVHLERLLRPVIRTVDAVIVVSVPAEIVAQLATDDTLLEKGAHALRSRLAQLGRLERGTLRAQLPKVKIRRESRQRRRHARLVPLRLVFGQPCLGQKAGQGPGPGRFAGLQPRYRWHGSSFNLGHVDQPLPVDLGRLHCAVIGPSRRLGRDLGELSKVLGQLAVDLAPDRPRSVLPLIRGHPNGDDVVRVDHVHGDRRGQRGAHPVAPLPPHSERGHVRDQRGRHDRINERRDLLHGVTLREKERDVLPGQHPFQRGESLEHEHKLPGPCVHELGHQVENDSNLRTLLPGLLDGIQQCPVVLHALLTRHPVEDGS